MKKFNITIAGGGSTYTPGIVLMLAEESYRFPVEEIKLYDNLASRQEPIGKAMEIMMKEQHPEISFLIQQIRKRHLRTLILYLHISESDFMRCVNWIKDSAEI